MSHVEYSKKDIISITCHICLPFHRWGLESVVVMIMLMVIFGPRAFIATTASTYTTLQYDTSALYVEVLTGDLQSH